METEKGMRRWSYCNLSEGVLRRWHKGWNGRTGRARLSAQFCSLPRLLGHSWLTLTADHKLCSRVSPQRRLQHVIVRWVALGPKM